MSIANYTWVPSADTGGGFANVCAIDSLNPGRFACGGDTWGVYASDNYGHNWYGCNRNSTGPYGRAVAFTKRPADSGDIFWGTGGEQSGVGSGSLGVTHKGDNAYITADGTNGFGTGFPKGFAGPLMPRPLGKLIRSEYYVTDGAGNDTEWVYTATPTGVWRYKNTNGLQNAAAPQRLSGANVFRASSLYNDSNLFVATTAYNPTGAAVTPQTIWITPNSGTLRTAAAFTSTNLTNAPAKLCDLETIKDSSGNPTLFAVAPTGLYVVTGSTFNTWNLIDGGFLDDIPTTLDGYATSNGGFVLTVGQADPAQSLPAGHGIAQFTFAGGGADIKLAANWSHSWVTTSGVSYRERGQDALDTSGGRNWWLGPSQPGSYRVGLDQTAWDSSVLRVDPNDHNKILVCGRAGAWTSEDGGSTWGPAMKGINGSTDGGITVSGSTISTTDTDHNVSISTDHYATCHTGSTGVGGGGTTSVTIASGTFAGTYTVNAGAGGGATMIVTQGGTTKSVGDFNFQGAICPGLFSDMNVDTSGYIYISRGAGGVWVGVPNASPSLIAPTLSTPTVSGLTINSSWSAATGGTGTITYQVYLGTTNPPTAHHTPSSGASGTTDSNTLPAGSSGNYFLFVRATDSGSPAQTADSAQFTVPIGVLSPPVITSPAAGSTINNFTLNAAWNPATGGTGIYTLYEVSYDNAAYQTASSGAIGLTDQHVFTTNGPHTLKVRVTDSGGSQAASGNVSFTINGLISGSVTAPTLNQVLPSGTVVTTWSAATGGVAPYTYTIQYDTLAFRAPSGSLTDTTTLTNGAHAVRVRATDSASNVVTSTQIPFSVAALAAPTPSSTVTGATATTTWGNATGGTAPYTYQVSYNGGAFLTPSGANQDVRTFANGSYTVVVKATDSASRTANSTAGSFTITVSLSPPNITSPTANQIITTASFTTTWNAGPGGVAPITFQVSYNNGTSYHTPSSGAGGLSDLFTFADGSYTALVKETDVNGLTATSASIPFQIATTHPPAPTIDTGPTAASGGSTPNTTASFSFHEPAWANPVTFAASVTGPVSFGNAAVTSPKTYSGLTAGTYTFSLTATDSVTGLSSSAATWVWTVSVVLPPEIPVITSGPSQGGQSGDFTVTISNTGTANLLIGTLSLSGANASEFDIKTDNASGRTILPGGSLTVILFFAPSSLGARTAILNIPNNADTNHTITLTGTGVPVGTPIASVSPSSVAFGQVFFGDTSPPTTITLTNTGLSGNLVTDVSTITGSASFVIINDNISGQSFAPGASGTLQLTYAPQSGSEVATGTLIITDNSNNVFGSTQSIGLTGSGKLRVAGISISPASLTYPTRTVGTTSPAQSITVTSTGSGNLILGTVTKTGANAADFTITANTVSGKTFGPTGGPTPFVNTGFEGALTDGGWTDEFGSGSLSIVSSPVRHGVGALNIDATLGDATGDILRYRNLASVNTLVFQFYIQIPSLPTAQAAILEAAGTGSGNPLAELVVTTAGKISISIVPANVLLSQTLSTNTWYLIDGLIDYSTTTLTMRTQISDTNATLLSSGVVTLAGTAQPGFAQLALGKIASGESAFIDDFRLQQSGYPILTGTSGSISVTFSPSAAGARTASLSIPDNAAGSPQTVLLSGTGLLTVPGISITPNPISFATTVIGSTSATQTATITNTGTADLIIGTVSLVGAEAGQFAIQTDNASGQTITPSGTRTVVMTFKPTLIGSHSATLSMTDNATGSPHTAILSGTGTIPAIPPLGHTVYAYYYPNYGLSAAEGFGSESYQGWGGTFPAPLGSGITHTFAPATSIASDYYPADYWTGAAGYPPKLYSSSDPVVLKAQCVAAIQAGINVFTVSWKPPPDRSDTLVSALLSAAQAATNQTGTPLYIAFLIEPWASCSFTDPTDSTVVTGGRSNAKVWRAINYLNSTYGGHPNFYRSARVGWHYAGRVAGANLFSLNHPEYDFLSGGTPNAVIDPNGTYWQTTTDNVHNPAKVPLGGLILAESSFNPTQVDGHHFDGGFIYLSLPLKQSGALDTDQYQYRRVYELGFPPTAICIPSIAPGYSAWRIQDTLDRRFLRSNGGFFDTQWYQALNGVSLYDVAITSFNDWQHGTQTEPATNQTLGTGQ